MKILIAEDDQHIRDGLVEILRREGYSPIPAKDGQDAINQYEAHKPEFVLLDIMMPKRDGYEVCRHIRTTNKTVPVMFISAKSEEIDRIVGLELGADDYLMKPFSTREVVARIKAIMRRTQALKGESKAIKAFTIGDLEVDPASLRARRGDDVIELSIRDVKILNLLLKHQGEVVDRDTMFNECWGRNYFPNSRTLDQHVSKLRKLVELDHKNPQIIKTVHGVGYRFDG